MIMKKETAIKARITHVALYVTDLERSKDFYVRYFNGTANEKYIHGAFESYFISFDSEMRLELMTNADLEIKKAISHMTGFSHIAISVGSEENVNKLTEQIVSEGYALYSPCRHTGDGYYESCVADPEGNRVEITI